MTRNKYLAITLTWIVAGRVQAVFLFRFRLKKWCSCRNTTSSLALLISGGRGGGGGPKEWKVIIRHTQITLSSYEIFRLYGLDDVEFNLNPYFLECLERQSFLKTVGGGRG